MSTELTFDELLDALSDDELNDIVAGAIESEVSEPGESIPSFPMDEHRIVYCIYSITGFLKVNGAASFLWLDCDHQAYVRALQALGFAKLAAGFQDLLSLTSQKNLGNYDALLADIGEHRLQQSADPLQNELYSQTEQITIALASYIKKNKEAYRSLLASMRMQTGYVGKFDPERLANFYASVDWDKIGREALEEVKRRTKG